MSPSDASASVSATARRLGADDAPAASFARSEASEALPALSGEAERYWRPAISAAASRAESRGASSIATWWTITMTSSSSNESQSMSNRSFGWYVPVDPGSPEVAMRRTASRISSSVMPKCCAASATSTTRCSRRYGTNDSRKTSLSGAFSGFERLAITPPPPPRCAATTVAEALPHGLAQGLGGDDPHLGTVRRELVGEHRDIRVVQADDPGILVAQHRPPSEAHLGVGPGGDREVGRVARPELVELREDAVLDVGRRSIERHAGHGLDGSDDAREQERARTLRVTVERVQVPPALVQHDGERIHGAFARCRPRRA